MQHLNLEAGKYVIAVSGGIDSVVLLDMLTRMPEMELVVAHVDHGIRTDSEEDMLLVRKLAGMHGWPFEMVSLGLGPKVSEATAREMRHGWLVSVRRKHAARGIVTAHHRDDVVETMLINLLRGTGWRGLSSIRNTNGYYRPLLDMPKSQIVRYAIDRELQWREDSTNDDLRYLRNYVRHGIASKLTDAQENALIELYKRQCELREQIEEEREELSARSKKDDALSRYWLIMTPDGVAKEFLRAHYGAMTQASADRLLHFARTARVGAKLTLADGHIFRVTAAQLIVCTSEDC